MELTYREYMLGQLTNLLAIDSTTGQHKAMEDYLLKETRALGLSPVSLRKGGVAVDLGGSGNGLVITSHTDDIGLIVRYINPTGTIRVCNVGGLYPWQCEQANVRLYTRDGRVYTGTMRRALSSLHLMNQEERTAAPDYEKNLYLFLDEDIKTAADVEALGIQCGDIIAVDPQTVFTTSGYIKSRFLDDKASTAVLLAYIKTLRDRHITPSRHVTVYFSFFEEVGHGGASMLPQDTNELLAIDIGCCGPTNYSDEKSVSICAMDTFSPYHREMIDDLVAVAKKANIQYALDLFVPHYGSDANAALRTGEDFRHALIGPGVLGTHGYERTHIKSLEETYKLVCAYAK